MVISKHQAELALDPIELRIRQSRRDLATVQLSQKLRGRHARRSPSSLITLGP
ncbi:hypothetical protein [Actinopolymorpha pittospori]|uniref:Uncharacterized protein n=1 Tax=Actinopolymorpha pittospori TaxID=648752 RepID=A0A927MVK4_9ACTN|nr:hypothetical protein [Actinopolymorpha pittospori]MBE1605608.1 hypothetical protein [Actinopolymorpha pittospori]